jgi:DNA-binding response OmpR family regulator
MAAKLLVVDDEQDFVDLMTFNLRMHGFEVFSARNGLDALAKARRLQPDLVVLDIMMDGIDGYTLCEILRRQLSTRDIPVIMVTAASGQIARYHGLAVGASEFLHKPFTSQELVRAIERVLAVEAAKAEASAALAGESSPNPDRN